MSATSPRATQLARLAAFVRESNQIEGIARDPRVAEIEAHEVLLARPRIEVRDLVEFVAVIAPGKPLRNQFGMDVLVGSHVPPRGGMEVEWQLERLLDSWERFHPPQETHVQYELLHPFMDGNGRSGRALWAWTMQQSGLDPFALPFLHRFYYQTLDAAR